MRVNVVGAMLVAALLVSSTFAQTATSPRPMPTPEVDYYAAGPPHPTYDEFFSGIAYPYRASTDRQRRIEHAARVIRIGYTEPQILKLLGQPDYKMPAVHFICCPQRSVADERWCYVHMLDGPLRDDLPPGKMLIILLNNRSKPRKVIVVDKVRL